MADSERSGLSYRGRPLLRKDDTLYYGRMSDKYIIMLQIQDKKVVSGVETATKVSVYLQQTNENIRPKERIVRKTEKPGLYEALDVGAVWLERALADKI
ncbi:MAG: hypothetical protein E7460_03625 [Ruminococcaceae bacterium]|nr:hypothetical protein [Oscillospiraceae bacterium]MBQ8898758.1 hypothetical protein [Clostridia bacterium]